mgnify:CR=1 FL=1
MTAPLKVFLIAGEPSGDRLGAALMAGLQTFRPEITFHGVGGPAMEAALGLLAFGLLATWFFRIARGRGHD